MYELSTILVASSPATAPAAGSFCLAYWPALLTMLVLLFGSAFFSSSEAAYFYLNRADRRQLATRGRLGQLATQLLDDSDRLLTAVLFWNLVINVGYFTVSSIVSLRLERSGNPAAAGTFAIGSLLAIIVISEVFPKSLAVIKPREMAYYWSVPLAAAVRIVTPILRTLQIANLLSRRLLWPTFQSEAWLRVSDLQRAVTLSDQDASLLRQEHQLLEQIVHLSEIRTEELMRPRNRIQWFVPPVSLSDLNGTIPDCGYLLITDGKNQLEAAQEISSAIPIHELSSLPNEHLELLAEPVIYVPWCATVADALEAMQRRDRQVAAVVNEYGEAIGILTFHDILDTLFGHLPSRTRRILKREPILKTGDNTWQIAGLASLRLVRRQLKIKFPRYRNMTIGGAVQEKLERLPEVGDVCVWDGFQVEVVEAGDDGQISVLLTKHGDTKVPPHHMKFREDV